MSLTSPLIDQASPHACAFSSSFSGLSVVAIYRQLAPANNLAPSQSFEAGVLRRKSRHPLTAFVPSPSVPPS